MPPMMTLLSSFPISSSSAAKQAASASVFDVVDDDIAAVVGVVETVIVRAALVVAHITIDPSSIVSFDFFSNPFATHRWRCSLGHRTSPLENSHPFSSSACNHRGIRNTQTFGLTPRLEFSSCTGEFCFDFDFPLLIAYGWIMVCLNTIPWLTILVCFDALRKFVDFCS